MNGNDPVTSGQKRASPKYDAAPDTSHSIIDLGDDSDDEPNDIRQDVLAAYVEKAHALHNYKRAVETEQKRLKELNTESQHVVSTIKGLRSKLEAMYEEGDSQKRRIEVLSEEVEDQTRQMKRIRNTMTGAEGFELAVRLMRAGYD